MTSPDRPDLLPAVVAESVTPEPKIQSAAQALLAGGLVAFPTETVYGLGADATSDAAVAQVYAVKGRPTFNPLIAHVADLASAEALGVFEPIARALAERFWPGPLTLVVPRREGCPVSLLASAGLDTLAIRVPNHPIALALLRATGRPVVAPSANPSGRVSPTTAQHVQDGLGDRVATVLDGGPCVVGVESTVVRVEGGVVTLLRPGGLARAALEAVVGCPVETVTHSEAPHAPGQLESHYAPSAPIRLDVAEVTPGEALLAFGPALPGAAHTLNLSPAGDTTQAAANLFAMLRALDQPGLAGIAVMPIPADGLGEAIRDRLRRAAAPRDT
jgi:L-threonylcarbamoyladenylate synthase